MKHYEPKHIAVLSDRGFYTILTVCGLIIAASAWVLWMNAGRGEQPGQALCRSCRKLQIPGGLLPVDAPGGGVQPCVEGGQHKAAAFFQRLLRQQIELGQRVRSIRLRHPEIRPRYMTSTHGNLLDKTRWCDYTINRRGADCKGQLSIPLVKKIDR